MSLTIKQEPGSSTLTTDFRVHGIYDKFYTALSSIYQTDNMKYKYNLILSNGIEVTTKTFPWTNGVGIFNSSKFLKENITHTFQPNILAINKCSTDIINYRVSLEENISGTTISTYNFIKCLGIRAIREDFNWQNHILKSSTQFDYGTSNGRFLTNFRDNLKVSLTNQHTIRALSGTFYNGINANRFSGYATSNIWVFKKDGTYKNYTMNNPYYNFSENGMLESNTILENVGAWLIDIPCGPYNINLAKKYLVWNENGQVTPNQYITTPVIDDDTTYYTIQSWSNEPKGETLRFDMICEADNAIRLGYENVYGATDYYNFNLLNKASIKVERSSFYKNNKGINSSYNMTTINNSGGYEIYNVDYNDIYEINSDWVTEIEANYLKELFISPNVYAYINSVWYKIVLLDDEYQIFNDQFTGLFQYNLKFRISNKKQL